MAGPSGPIKVASPIISFSSLLQYSEYVHFMYFVYFMNRTANLSFDDTMRDSHGDL